MLDLSDRFCRQVVDVFAEEYRRGRTPNPCVVCNRTIKFGGMLDYARQQGYDAIATGHYVRRAYWEEGKRWQLFRADSRKDQSYVLYGLSQDQLAQVRFPLYGLEKEEVRRLARENGLPVAEKGDSMEICFVPEGEHAAFIERYSGQPDREGVFVSPDGERLSPHGGISRYTVGQRKGLGLSLIHIYGYHGDIDELRFEMTDGKGIIARIEAQEKERTGIQKLKVGYNRVFGYYIEITNSNLDSVPEDYIRKQTLTTCERFITPHLKELEERIMTASERILALEAELFEKVRTAVDNAGDRLKTVCDIISVTDSLVSLADAAAKYNYTMPERCV